MKKKERKIRKKGVPYASGKTCRDSCLKAVCWIIIPVIAAALLALDALGIYRFNAERLTVLGIGLVIILLPFFSEITLKGICVKRDKPTGKP